MPYVDIMIEPEPQSQDEFLEIINSTKPTGLQNWWNTNLQPLIDKLDEQLERKGEYAKQ